MFEISNKIAYDGMMINAAPRSCEHPLLGRSTWFDVKGKATVRQWVPEQGEVALNLLLKILAVDEIIPDIFIITPFREVRTQFRRIVEFELKKRNFPREIIREVKGRIGTIHTFQGKEAKTVILLLGCDFSKFGAADWAGEKPNLVNVAVTRAKDHLYVIGDRNLWHNRGYFSDLEKGIGEFKCAETI